VEKEILRPDNGPKPRPGQSVTVHCTGYGKNEDLSQKFWSTKDPGQKPFTFTIGQGKVIKGWDEGILDMQLGEVSRLRVTSIFILYCFLNFICVQVESLFQIVN
jgi:FKBP-type peptidyl-prolyl cis-trans isomerase